MAGLVESCSGVTVVSLLPTVSTVPSGALLLLALLPYPSLIQVSSKRTKYVEVRQEQRWL